MALLCDKLHYWNIVADKITCKQNVMLSLIEVEIV